jgi:hypothetical protein
MKPHKLKIYPLAFGYASLAFVMAATANASLLIEEQFDYAMADGTDMHGVAATGTGLQGEYAVRNAGGSSTYATSGLSFGSNFFTTSGGALSVTTTAIGNQFSILGVQMDVVAQTGTLWHSHLFRIPELGERVANASAIGTRINTGATTGGADSYFGVNGDNNSTLAPASNPGVDYAGGTNTSATSDPATKLSENTTYLALAKFTNVGTALSAGDPGVASLWVFDQSGYEDWRAAGSSEASLGDHATWTITESMTSGTYNFNSSAFLQFYVFNQSVKTAIDGLMDEVRWGTTLDAVAIPQPSGSMHQ